MELAGRAPAANGAAKAPQANGAANAPRANGSAPPATGRVFASPLARRIAKEAGLDIASVKGSGPHGRIVERDVRSAVANPPKAAPAPAAQAPAPAAAP